MNYPWVKRRARLRRGRLNGRWYRVNGKEQKHVRLASCPAVVIPSISSFMLALRRLRFSSTNKISAKIMTAMPPTTPPIIAPMEALLSDAEEAPSIEDTPDCDASVIIEGWVSNALAVST